MNWKNLKSCMVLFYQTLFIPHMWLKISINEQIYNVEKFGQKFMAHLMFASICLSPELFKFIMYKMAISLHP